jgi:hypothetical protein
MLKSNSEIIHQQISHKTSASSPEIVDLALIYHGGAQRVKWTSHSLKHYIYRETGNGTQWLYDGFLFLEFKADINGQQVDFEYDGLRGGRAAIQSDWIWLLDRTFAKGEGPHAVESVLDSLAKKKKYPPFKRKAVFALPTPIFGQKNWGRLNGEELHFEHVKDRAKAVIWYVDRVMEQWKKGKYKHLDFGGFYWTHEAVLDKHADRELLRLVKEYLTKINQPFSWIPYYGAENSPYWRDLGFDIAYQQPNYFFEEKTPMEILTGAIRFAQDNKLSLEMEYDDRIDQPAFAKKFYAYIEKFDEVKAWDRLPIAYYDGDGAWYHMAVSKSPELQKMSKFLGDIIVKRQLNYKNITNRW